MVGPASASSPVWATGGQPRVRLLRPSPSLRTSPPSGRQGRRRSSSPSGSHACNARSGPRTRPPGAALRVPRARSAKVRLPLGTLTLRTGCHLEQRSGGYPAGDLVPPALSRLDGGELQRPVEQCLDDLPAFSRVALEQLAELLEALPHARLKPSNLQ